MTVYVYPPMVAVNTAVPGSVVVNGSGQVYALTDPTYSKPLTITDINGTPLAALYSNGVGLVQQFKCDGYQQVMFYASGVPVLLTAPFSGADLATAVYNEAAVPGTPTNIALAAMSDGRLTAVESKNTTQDARLANLDSAAGFTGSPLTLNDSAVAAALTGVGNASKAALDNAINGVRRLAAGWTASTAYIAGQMVVAPDGNIVTAKVAFTSGTTYTATNWDTPSLTALVAAATDSAEVIQRTNYATNPSAAVNLTNWTANGGTGLTRQATAGADGTIGYVRNSWSAAGSGGVNVTASMSPVPLAVGDRINISIWVRHNRAAVTTIQFGGYYKLGTVATGGGSYGYYTVVPANTWTRLSASLPAATATADNVYNYIYFSTVSGGTMPVAGDYIEVDNLLVERGTVLGQYFDGNTPLVGAAYHKWGGTPDASTSVEITSGTLVKRDTYGSFSVNTPLTDGAVTPRSYVDAAARMGGGLFRNVKEAPYFAKGDGVTDDTAAIQKAFDDGGLILIPATAAGYSITGVGYSSNTSVWGQGMGRTRLFAPNAASWNTRLIYPKSIASLTTNVDFNDFTLDGNQPNRTLTGGSGGIYGTNLSIVYSSRVRVNRVESIRPTQHCFDVTTPIYTDAGDGAPVVNPSFDVRFTDCYADLHGDDGFTTHGSNNIQFTRCHSGGTWWATLTAYTNANGFEIDDYSSDVTLTDCTSTGNAHGFEIKAHGNMSASSNVRLNGCRAWGNQVNFSLRHIGHTDNPSPLTVSAKNVQLTNCTSWNPKRVFFFGAEDFNQYAALVVASYRGVTITNFHAIGNPADNYNGAAAIEFGSLCEDIVLNGYHVEGHVTSGCDVQSYGGASPAKNVTITNGIHRDSSPNGVSTGSESNGIINNISLSRSVYGSPNGYGIRAYGNKIVRSNRIVTAYSPNYLISDVAYSVYETPLATNVLA